MSLPRFGLFHTPRAEIVTILTEQEIENIFQDFEICLDENDLYVFFHKDHQIPQETLARRRGNGKLRHLVRAEFELKPFTEQQIKEFYAAMDKIRNSRANRKRTGSK